MRKYAELGIKVLQRTNFANEMRRGSKYTLKSRMKASSTMESPKSLYKQGTILHRKQKRSEEVTLPWKLYAVTGALWINVHTSTETRTIFIQKNDYQLNFKCYFMLKYISSQSYKRAFRCATMCITACLNYGRYISLTSCSI